MENELRDAIIGGQLFKLKMDGLGNEWVWEKTKDGLPTSYVNSSDPNAYPPAEPDGYTYTPLGQLGNKVRIETGSYVGTGTYGESTPNSLTFGFEPKLILLQQGGGNVSFYAIQGNTSPRVIGANYIVNFSWGKNLSWYSTDTVWQFNNSGNTYYYLAIG